MLGEIIANGTDRERERAIRTLTQAEQVRGQRRALTDISHTMMSFAGAASTVKQRTIYDAREGSTLPGTLVRKEGDPPVSDPAVNEAYDGSGATYDLFNVFYGRNSLDDYGMELNSTVHYQKGYDNAFWDGKQMVYGDGDEDLPVEQRVFNRFTISIDIIGHELTHGITQFEANLAYYGQSGALNESMSDVFGSLVKQYQRGHTAATADWIIGEGLFTSRVNGVGIRSMKAPGTAYDDPLLGKDPQPAHMKDYVNTTQDNGGVHINSGIPNHAFYVTALEIGGSAWEKAGLIWYLALRDKLKGTTDFQTAADQTYAVAAEKFGAGSLEQQAVAKGWAAVGITVSNTAPPPIPTPTPGGEGCLTAVFRKLGLLRSR
jgi:Zn-dependent metalloprotease